MFPAVVFVFGLLHQSFPVTAVTVNRWRHPLQASQDEERCRQKRIVKQGWQIDIINTGKKRTPKAVVLPLWAKPPAWHHTNETRQGQNCFYHSTIHISIYSLIVNESAERSETFDASSPFSAPSLPHQHPAFLLISLSANASPPQRCFFSRMLLAVTSAALIADVIPLALFPHPLLTACKFIHGFPSSRLIFSFHCTRHSSSWILTLWRASKLPVSVWKSVKLVKFAVKNDLYYFIWLLV